MDVPRLGLAMARVGGPLHTEVLHQSACQEKELTLQPTLSFEKERLAFSVHQETSLQSLLIKWT